MRRAQYDGTTNGNGEDLQAKATRFATQLRQRYARFAEIALLMLPGREPEVISALVFADNAFVTAAAYMRGRFGEDAYRSMQAHLIFGNFDQLVHQSGLSSAEIFRLIKLFHLSELRASRTQAYQEAFRRWMGNRQLIQKLS